MGMSVEGWASVAAGEDWHYVGDATTGLGTTLGSDWSAVGSPWPAPAFRLREAGVVDLIGVVECVVATNAAVFTLPEGYRPNEQAFFVGFLTTSPTTQEPILVAVTDIGEVVLAGPTPDVGHVLYFSGSIFLTTAAP